MYKRRPPWLKKQVPFRKEINEVKNLLVGLELNTVCQSAKCPNISECFARKTATFMILGDTCTRDCKFCSVPTGKPQTVDQKEPAHVAAAVEKLALEHIVITSVTRDDLADGGVGQFIKVIEAILAVNPKATVEILTPDFKGDEEILAKISLAPWHVYNHNIETVPRLYKQVRPQGNYQRSLDVLRQIKERRPNDFTKSGLMVGLGESKDEVIALMKDLLEVGCDYLTIGQYLQPTLGHLEVVEYIEPEKFTLYGQLGEELGFKGVASGPFVRSSYKAADLFKGKK